MTRQTKIIQVLDTSMSGYTYNEFTEEIQKLVPEEYLDTVEFDADYDRIQVSYTRPETDDEMKERLAKEQLKTQREVLNDFNSFFRIIKNYHIIDLLTEEQLSIITSKFKTNA